MIRREKLPVEPKHVDHSQLEPGGTVRPLSSDEKRRFIDLNQKLGAGEGAMYGNNGRVTITTRDHSDGGVPQRYPNGEPTEVGETPEMPTADDQQTS